MKKSKLLKYLMLLVVPMLVTLITIIISDNIVLSLEVFFLMTYFIMVVYFTKDLFSPFLFFFVNIFLGVMDIYFVSLKFRNVLDYHSIQIYEKSLFLIIIWLSFFVIGYKLTPKRLSKYKYKDKILSKKVDNRMNIFLILCSGVILCFTAFKVFMTIKATGKISMDIAFFDGQKFLIALYPLCGYIPICFLAKGKKIKAIISDILIFVVIALSGRRYIAIITTIFPFLIYYNYKIKKINVKNLLLLAIPVIIFVIMVGHVRLQKSHQVYSENPFLNVAITMGKYIQYGQNLPDLVYAIDTKKIDYQGCKYAFRGVIGLIPRSLWENKPEVDYSYITSELVYGHKKGYGEPVGQFGWAYLCFGHIGVIVSGFITGIISSLFYTWMRKNNDAFSIGTYALLIMQVINIFTPESQMKIILFIIYILFIKILSLIKIDGVSRLLKEDNIYA